MSTQELWDWASGIDFLT